MRIMTGSEIAKELDKVTSTARKDTARINGDPAGGRFHSVVICWIDELGYMSHKEGWFTSYTTAKEYMESQIEIRRKAGSPTWAYLDDWLEWKQAGKS